MYFRRELPLNQMAQKVCFKTERCYQRREYATVPQTPLELLSDKTAALLNKVLLAFCTIISIRGRVISCSLWPILAFFQILRFLISDLFYKIVAQPLYLQMDFIYENQTNPLAFCKTLTNMNIHLLLIHYCSTSNHYFDFGKLYLRQNEIKQPKKPPITLSSFSLGA